MTFHSLLTRLIILVAGWLLPQCVQDDASISTPAKTVRSDTELDTDSAEDSGCLYKTVVLDSLDLESERVGFTGGELLYLFEGEQLHHARYAIENEIVEQSPLGGDTLLLLTVKYQDGEIRDLIGKDPSCGNYLEVDVTVSARTSDTAFAEEVDGTLYFYKNEVENVFTPRLYAVLDAAGLEGQFEIQGYIDPPSPESVLLYLDQIIDEEGAHQGSIIVMTSEAGEDIYTSDSYQRVLGWQTKVFL